MEARERYFIENTDKCVNINLPTRSKKENMEDKKEHYIIYKQEWYENNKEAQSITSKEWYEHNKEAQSLKSKECVVCECGVEVCKGALQKHLQTKKHNSYLNPS